MQKVSGQYRHVCQLASILLSFIVDAMCFLALCLRPSPILAAENLFLRLSLNPHIVGVILDGPAVFNLLQGLVDHPHHHYAETAPALTAPSFGELVPNIMGYRQVPDATLLYLARVHGMKLITFDRPRAAMRPWPEHLELLTL